MEYEHNRRNYKILEEKGIFVNQQSDNIDKDKPRILFVEDEVICIKAPILWMNKRGLKGCFDIATNAIDALKMLNNLHYDLIITDVGLPFMDGVEFIKIVRMQHSRHIPIIALTAYGDDEMHDCIMAGCDIALQKSGNFEELLDAIVKCLTIR